jgi:hypothetical protein
MRLAGVAYSNIERYNIIFAVPAECVKRGAIAATDSKSGDAATQAEIKTCAEA